MGQAGLLKTADATHLGSPSPAGVPIAITWDGYEFLEASRNDTIWAKAKQAANSVGGTALEGTQTGFGGTRYRRSKKGGGVAVKEPGADAGEVPVSCPEEI